MVLRRGGEAAAPGVIKSVERPRTANCKTVIVDLRGCGERRIEAPLVVERIAETGGETGLALEGADSGRDRDLAGTGVVLQTGRRHCERNAGAGFVPVDVDLVLQRADRALQIGDVGWAVSGGRNIAAAIGGDELG